MLLAVLVSVFCSTLTATFSAFVSYHFLLLFYTVAYRLSPLHPLALYPGPVYARVSKWWSSYICADGKQHIYYKTLHDRFGDVVRVGEFCCAVLRNALTEKYIRRRPQRTLHPGCFGDPICPWCFRPAKRTLCVTNLELDLSHIPHSHRTSLGPPNFTTSVDRNTGSSCPC